MTDPFLGTILAGFSIWHLVKIFVLVGLFVYVLFALVIVRQVRLMMDTVHIGLEGIILLITWIHFFLAIGIFALSLVIL
jgi:hypothetical protein